MCFALEIALPNEKTRPKPGLFRMVIDVRCILNVRCGCCRGQRMKAPIRRTERFPESLEALPARSGRDAPAAMPGDPGCSPDDAEPVTFWRFARSFYSPFGDRGLSARSPVEVYIGAHCAHSKGALGAFSQKKATFSLRHLVQIKNKRPPVGKPREADELSVKLCETPLLGSFQTGRIVVQDRRQPAFCEPDIPTLACGIVLHLVPLDLADTEIVAVAMTEIEPGDG